MVFIILISFLFVYEEAGLLHFSIRHMLSAISLKYAIGGIFVGAICILLDRVVLQTVDALSYMVFSRFIMLLVFLVITFTKYGGIKRVVRGLTVSGWFILLYAILHLGVVYYYNLAMADPEAVSGLVAIIRHTSLIFTILLGGGLLREKGINDKFLLGVSILIALYLIVIK